MVGSDLESRSEMRLITLVIGILGLAAMYLFKGELFYDPWEDFVPQLLAPYPDIDNTWLYIGGKYLRFFINDFCMFLIVYTLFPLSSTMRLGIIVFLFGALLLLPVYLILALNPGDFTVHYIPHLHRITMNPVLMLLLIPAIYLQRRRLL